MALYHKHRPQTFENVVGQEHIIQTITNQIMQGRIAHAYLFSGPRGVGKTTTARLLAKAVNCQNRKEQSSEPCDECQSCKEIIESRSIDVIEIDAASYTGVDNVRDNIIDNAQFRPTRSKFKVFIIDEVHMLSTAAFNALLKILEEPPEYIIFILATTELHKIPDTVISRCQRFGFKKVGYDEMKKYLEKVAKEEGIRVDKEVFDKIINKSDSCVRDAVSLLDQAMATGEKHITTEIVSVILPSSNVDETIRFISFLVNKNAAEAIKQINKLADEGASLKQFINDTVELLRIMMITKANLKTESLGIDLSHEAAKELLKLNKDISSEAIITLIDLLLKRRTEIQNSPIPQLPLELAVIEWCGDNSRPDKNDDNHQQSTQITETKPKEQINKTIETEQKIIIKAEEKPLIAEVKEEKAESQAKSDLNLADVQNKWDEFIKKIEKKSASLTFILKSASLHGVSGNIVCISVGFSLHKEKIMGKVCQKDIENILSEVINQRVRIDVIVTEQQETEEKIIDTELQDLTAAFGGEIVS